MINCYGEQRKNSKEDVEGKWMRLRREMETIRARGEFCLCSGDLNKLVGSGPGGIPGNHPEVSLGGRLRAGGEELHWRAYLSVGFARHS